MRKSTSPQIPSLPANGSPLTLGNGKRLFVDGSIPAAFKLTESKVSPKGVIIVNYERAGDVKTGSFAD